MFSYLLRLYRPRPECQQSAHQEQSIAADRNTKNENKIM